VDLYSSWRRAHSRWAWRCSWPASCTVARSWACC
jgi:hypothetical protein